MPSEVIIPQLPGGYAVTSALPDQELEICTRQFVSTEDGSWLIRLLEGFPTQILNLLPGKTAIRASMIDNFLAIIYPSKRVKVYVNDLRPVITARAKHAISQGAEVTLNDFIDVEYVRFDGVTVPDECGLVYIFSRGWRKGMFYDFEPISDPNDLKMRDYDLGRALAECHSLLMYQERLNLSEDAWDRFFAEQWFPFVHLDHGILINLARAAESGHPLDAHLSTIVTFVKDALPAWIKNAEDSEILQPHLDLLKIAAKHYEAGDFLSAAALLYPRIEGVLRTAHARKTTSRATQGNLSRTGAGGNLPPKHRASLMLPGKFERYLKDVYFADFDPADPQGVSRNTIGHGVAPLDSMNEKAAAIGWLILMHIGTLAIESSPP
jgi:hypothetical protein